MNVRPAFVQQSAILVVGGMMTAAALFMSLPTGALMALAGVAAITLVVNCRRLRRSQDVAVLIIASVIVFAYFLRYFIVAADPELIYFMVPRLAWPAFHSSAVLEASLSYATAAFIAFCTSTMFFRLSLLATPTRRPTRTAWRFPRWLVLASAVMALVVVDLLMVTFGIGRQGQFVESPLPFKLTGAIAYMKTVVVPCMFGLCIYWAQSEGKSVQARATVVLVLCSAAFDMVLFSSRGALLNHVLFVALVWLMAGFKIKKIDMLLISGAVCAALFAVPIITLFRLYNATLEVFSLQQIYVGMTFVMFRITGIDQFMVILDLGAPLPIESLWNVLSSQRGVGGYYTVNLLGVPESVPQTYAPSAIGWLYIVGGGAAIVAGAALFACLLVYAWKALDTLMPSFADVAKAFVVWQSIVLITEGVVGIVMTAVSVGLTALWFAEQVLVQRTMHRYALVARRAYLVGSIS